MTEQMLLLLSVATEEESEKVTVSEPAAVVVSGAAIVDVAVAVDVDDAAVGKSFPLTISATALVVDVATDDSSRSVFPP